ncbi:hypothetical protein FRB97_005033, partial [Tulasnella sp. 331]
MQGHLQQNQAEWKVKVWEGAKLAIKDAASLCEGYRLLQWRVWEVDTEIATQNMGLALILT